MGEADVVRDGVRAENLVRGSCAAQKHDHVVGLPISPVRLGCGDGWLACGVPEVCLACELQRRATGQL